MYILFHNLLYELTLFRMLALISETKVNVYQYNNKSYKDVRKLQKCRYQMYVNVLTRL